MKEKESPYVLGIDLGTTNTSASVFTDRAIQTISLSPTVANPGGKSLPSVVRFKERKKDQRVVGKQAKDAVLIAPQEVFSSIKTIMRSEADWKEDPVLLEKYSIEGEQLEPVHMAAEILKTLVEEVHTQEAIDMGGEIVRAVVCVPANSTDAYKENVYRAVALAGIGKKDDTGEVVLDEQGHPVGVSLLEEPIAAAIKYAEDLGFLKEEKEQIILVYDLGGGTFDVTVLKLDSTQHPAKYEVVATNGVAELGGDDFDHALMDLCATHFQSETGIDIFDLKTDQKATSPKALKQAQQKLKEASEEAKKAFAGGANREEINIANFLKDGDGNNYNLEVEVKKQEFVERISPLLEKAQQCVRDVLEEAKLELDDLNRVVLVGGSTKADWVKDSILKLYPAGEEREPFVAADVDSTLR